LVGKQLAPEQLLFPISGRVPGGIERKTHVMMRHAAREAWITEAATQAERQQRTQSEFLAYSNAAGLFADFHSCRHLFFADRANFTSQGIILAMPPPINPRIGATRKISISESIMGFPHTGVPGGRDATCALN